ncbi:hypothetical protein VTK26DRAFT_3587 [Humicola hyalothermophila]
MAAETHQLPCSLVGSCEIELPKHRHPGEPEKYRLSNARLQGAGKHTPTSTPIGFWFRTRYISALSSDLACDRPHLRLLQIRPSALAALIARCVSFLPAFAQVWVKSVFVEWFLPDRAVLKTQKQDAEEEITTELFETEVKAYSQLKPLQGIVIPRCYGRLRFNGVRALLLEHLGGVSLVSPEGATLTLQELSDLLQPCYRALHAFGVHHEDPHLGNFQLVDGKMMVLDFERVAFHLSPEARIFFMKTNIWDLADRYLDAQVYYRHEGLLEAA